MYLGSTEKKNLTQPEQQNQDKGSKKCYTMCKEKQGKQRKSLHEEKINV